MMQATEANFLIQPLQERIYEKNEYLRSVSNLWFDGYKLVLR